MKSELQKRNYKSNSIGIAFEDITNIVSNKVITNSQLGVYNLSLYRQRKNAGHYPKIVIRKKGKQLTIFNDEQIAEVEQLAVTMTIGEIAKHFGIGKKTFYDIRKRQPEVFLAYKKGNARKIEYVTDLLMSKIRNGCVSSIIFFLKTQAGWRQGMHDAENAFIDRVQPKIEIPEQDKISTEERIEFELWKQERSNSKR